MKNKYAGICNLCGKSVGAKKGRFRAFPKHTQDFTGLRCMRCSTTSKKGVKNLKNKGLIDKHNNQSYEVRWDLLQSR